jgi:hypothetical protein
MAIYRPSETKAWLSCPVKRSLEYLDGWRPRGLGRKHLAMLLGTGIHAGAAYYHNAAKERTPCLLAEAQNQAVVCVRSELKKYLDAGCVVRAEEQQYLDRLENRVAWGVRDYLKSDVIRIQGWEVLHVEQRLENYGGCTIDLGVRTPLGLAIADVKTKLTLDDRYRAKTRNEYSVDWQMRHYVWSYSQYMGQPVREYYIILVTLEPFSVEVWPYSVTPEDISAWGQSADHVWELMVADEVSDLSWQNLTSCYTSFGPCDYLKACHTHHYEESLMRTEYVQLGGR